VPTRHLLPATILALCTWALPFGIAHADTVLYNSSGFIQGQESFVQSFDITTAGTLTVSLSNIPWLDTISDLNVFFTTARGELGSSMGPGTETMKVSPGMIYAHWFGDADGAFGLGVYGLKINFQAANMTTPVPLSTSWIFLLLGLAILFGCSRRRMLPLGARVDDKRMTIW